MVPHAHSVEIYNHGCQVECARPDGTYLLDLLLNEGHRLTAYAADDAHFRIDDGFGGWMMVKAEANEPDALLSAMKAGDFYSSQGPLIHAFAVEGGEAHVECSPAVNVALARARQSHRQRRRPPDDPGEPGARTLLRRLVPPGGDRRRRPPRMVQSGLAR